MADTLRLEIATTAARIWYDVPSPNLLGDKGQSGQQGCRDASSFCPLRSTRNVAHKGGV